MAERYGWLSDGVDVDLFKLLSDVPTRNGCIGDAVGSAGLVERYPNNNPNPPRMSVISKFLEAIFYQKNCENLNIQAGPTFSFRFCRHIRGANQEYSHTFPIREERVARLNK